MYKVTIMTLDVENTSEKIISKVEKFPSYILRWQVDLNLVTLMLDTKCVGEKFEMLVTDLKHWKHHQYIGLNVPKARYRKWSLSLINSFVSD